MRRFGNCECGQPALAAYSGKPVCPDCAADGYGEPEPRPAPKADGLVEEAAGLFARLDGLMNADETELVDTILAALSDRDVVLEEAAKVAEGWMQGSMLSGDCATEDAQRTGNAIAQAIRALKGGVDE